MTNHSRNDSFHYLFLRLQLIAILFKAFVFALLTFVVFSDVAFAVS